MRVIWKATEKEQAKRYQTALEFKAAIAEALLPDPPLSEKIGKWVEGHVLLIALLTVALAVVIFIITLIMI